MTVVLLSFVLKPGICVKMLRNIKDIQLVFQNSEFELLV